MESSKLNDSHDEDTSSPYTSYPFNSWHEIKEVDVTTDSINSRKRKIGSEISENDNLSEKTLLVPKREKNTSTSSDLYGLKKEFLKSLGIELPLDQWVYVTNFRCDKSEIKEVFGLAGNVIICSVVPVRERYANIMFSHPLEAVQAISMFNGQTLYGMKLKVTMINTPSDAIILPKGLKDIGPGLGFNGRPLKDIVKHYKKYTKYQDSLVDGSLFRRENYNNDEEKEYLDSKSIDSEIKCKDSGDNTYSSNRRKYFKITNVEDLTVKDTSQDTNVSENQSKKPKCNEVEEESSSDEEIADPRIVLSLADKLAREKKKNQVKETQPKVPPISVNKKQNIEANLKIGAASTNHGQNYQPPSQPIGLQYWSSQSLGNIGPSKPIGPSGPVAPFCPSGPTVPPVRPNVPMMAPVGPNGPMMGPVGPNGPMMGPVGPNGPMMGPVGPNGPMMGPVGPNGPMAPMHQNGPIRPFGPPSGMMGPMGPSGPFGPSRPPGPNVPPVMQGPNQGPRPMIHGNAPPSGSDDVITIQFRNLPPSTTFPLLCEKVSQCGQVLSLQLTSPGCAVAKFAHQLHAERCFHFFNGLFIDGCRIEVRFA